MSHEPAIGAADDHDAGLEPLDERGQCGAEADEGVRQDRPGQVVAVPGPFGDGVHVGSHFVESIRPPPAYAVRIARRETVSSNGRPSWTTRWMLPSGGTVGPEFTGRPRSRNAEPTPVPRGDAHGPVMTPSRSGRVLTDPERVGVVEEPDRGRDAA